MSPFGRSQAEKRYILDTVIAHLPKVTGNETDMNVYVIQKAGTNCSDTHDEFGQRSNLGNGKGDRFPTFETQSQYLIIVNGNFRGRTIPETVREFTKWLCRLAKRIWVDDIIVEITDKFGGKYIFDDSEPYLAMHENPSWCNDSGEPNWCEFLMWDRAKDSMFPMILGYKYYADEENDKEAERRLEYGRRKRR